MTSRALLVFLIAVSGYAQALWEKPAFSLSAKELQTAAEAAPKGGDAETVVLTNDRDLLIDAQQRTVSRYHTVYRINTPGGVRNWDSISVHWEPWHNEPPVIRARVITPDGAVHELDPKTIVDNSARSGQEFSDAHVTSAPLPGVEAGAVVEKEIVVREKVPVFAEGLVRRIYFNSSAPVEHARLVLEAPSSIPLRYSVKLLGSVAPAKTEAGGQVRLVFEFGHRDAAGDGTAYLPYEIADQPYISVSTATSWAAVARAYSAIVEKQLLASDVGAMARRAGSGKTGRDAIAAALLAELHKQVRYTAVELGEASIVPREPAETLRRKYGDCKDQAALLVALLRVHKIPAHVALLSAGDDHDVDEDQPGFGLFNHAIVYLPASAGAAEQWVDPTDEFARFGEIPLSDQGRMGLVARPETQGLTRIPEAPSSANRTKETREFFLAEMGKARVVETTEVSGSIELGYRPSYKQAEAQQRTKDLRGYVKRSYFSDEEPKVEFSEPADLSKPFRLRLEFQKAGRGATDSESAVVGVPLSGLLNRLPDIFSEPEKEDDKKRTEDFLLPEAFVAEWDYRITAPPGFRPAALPEAGEQKLGPAVLAKTFAIAPDGVVHATFRFDTVKRRLSPTEFSAMRKAVRELHEAKVTLIQFEQTGQALLAAGDIGGALAEFQRLVQLHPKEALHHSQIAHALLAAGAGEAARREARAATELDPKSAEAFVALAWILQNDLIGRPFGKGSDLAAAEQAYRKVKELDPDNSAARAQLAILLEHAPRGVRYESKEKLAQAIEEYRPIQEKLADNFKNNILFALFWAGRYDELKERVAADHTPGGDQFYLAAVAAASGGRAAAAEAGRRIATVQARQTALRNAAQFLMSALLYEQAADVLDSIAVAAGAAEIRNLAAALHNVVKANQAKPGPQTPQDAVRPALLAMLSKDGGNLEEYLSTAYRGHAAEIREGARMGFAAAEKQLAKAGIPARVAVDLAMAVSQSTAEGDDAVGHRVNMDVGGHKMRTYMVKEHNAYLIRGMEDNTRALGEEAAARIERGELAAAKRWLDWARDEEQLGGGEDPLSGYAFPRLWNKSDPADATRLRVAAAALLARHDDDGKSIAILKQARQNAQTDADRLNLDLALAEGAAHRKQGDELLAIAARLQERYPESDTVFIFRLQGLGFLKRFAEGARLVDERIARKPDEPLAYYMGSTMAASDNNLVRSAELLKRIIALGKGGPTHLNGLAWNYLVQGKNLDEALDVARRAAMPEASARFPELHTLACIYAEMGKTAEAKQIILQAMDTSGIEEPNEASWYVFGRIAEQFGLRDTARDYYGRLGRPKVEDPTSTWMLAQRRIAALK